MFLDQQNLEVINQFRSLFGTIRNCSNGVAPLGSWLTCEESTTGPGHKYGDGLRLPHRGSR